MRGNMSEGMKSKHLHTHSACWSSLFHFLAFCFLLQSKLLSVWLPSFVYRTPNSGELLPTHEPSTARGRSGLHWLTKLSVLLACIVTLELAWVSISWMREFEGQSVSCAVGRGDRSGWGRAAGHTHVILNYEAETLSHNISQSRLHTSSVASRLQVFLTVVLYHQSSQVEPSMLTGGNV